MACSNTDVKGPQPLPAILKVVFPETLSGHVKPVNMIIRLCKRVFRSHLTHWGRVTQICVSKLTPTIGSDNDLSPGRRQVIIRTNAGISLIETLGTNFSGFFFSKFINFHSRKCIWKYRLENGGHFVSASMCYTPEIISTRELEEVTWEGLIILYKTFVFLVQEEWFDMES